jgi:hypothetical protein
MIPESLMGDNVFIPSRLSEDNLCLFYEYLSDEGHLSQDGEDFYQSLLSKLKR